MNIPEPIILLGTVLVWTLLVGLLGRASYKAMNRKRKAEGVLLFILAIAIVLFTAQWILFFIWLIACSIGLPVACMK